MFEETKRLFLSSTAVQPDCLVWGALCLTLRVSKYCGVAPVQLSRAVGGGCRAATSLTPFVISVIFTLIMELATLLAIRTDLDEPEDGLFRLYTWAAIVYLYMAMSGISVLTSFWTVKTMIRHLNILNTIRKTYVEGDWQLRDTAKNIFIAIVFLSGIPLHFYSVWRFMRDNFELNPFTIFYAFNAVQFVMTVMKVLQFIYFAYYLYSGQTCINDKLELLAKTHDKRPITSKEINLTQDTRSIVSDLANYYAEVLMITRQVNKTFNMVLLLILSTVFVQMVISSYILTTVMDNVEQEYFEISYRLLIFLWHTLVVIVLTEPGQKLHGQFRRVQSLLGVLLRDVQREDPVAMELSFFFKQSSLNRKQLNAMGLCTLSRSLILGMVSGMTTYVIIIMQFATLYETTEAARRRTTTDMLNITAADNFTDFAIIMDTTESPFALTNFTDIFNALF